MSFWLTSASVWSIETRMEAREPEIIEKKVTPTIMRRVQKTCSWRVEIGMSPYPTVVMVVTIK